MTLQHAANARDEDRLSRVLDDAHEAFVGMDADGCITDWNRAAEELFGWPRGEVIGRVLSGVIIPPALREAHDAGLRRFLITGERHVTGRRIELVALHRAGHEVPIELTVSCAATDQGTAFHAFVHDISERRAAAEQAELLAAVVRTSGDAIVATTRDGAISAWNAAAEELYGYAADEALGQSVAYLVPPGHERDLADISRTVVDEQRTYRGTGWRRRKDGHVFEVSLTISPLLDATGAVIGRSAIARDLTERRRAAAELAAADERFAQAFEHAPTGMAIAALDGRFVQANHALREYLGLTERAILTLGFADVIHPDEIADHDAAVRDLLAGRRDTLQGERRVRRADGRERWCSFHVSVAHDGDGAPAHLVLQALDITATKRNQERLVSYTGELKARTSEDPQTGLPARRELHAAMDERIAAGDGFTLVLLCAEGLRELNARSGYAAGDRALRGLAAAASGVVRDGDELFRCSGATLAVLMPPAAEGDALEAAERIRGELDQTHPGLRIGCGLASWPTSAWDPAELMRQARQDILVHPGPASSEPVSGGLGDEATKAVQRMLTDAREHLGMDLAWMTEFTDGQIIFRGLSGDSASFGIEQDLALPLSGTFCVRVLDGRLPAAIPDTAADPVAAALEVTTAAGVGAYAGAPIRLADGRVYGMLCAVAHDSRPSLDESDAQALGLLASVIAARLDEEWLYQDLRRVDVEGTGVSALLAALDARDHYTGDHSQAVVELSGAVARAMGLTPAAVSEVEQVALLHDVGKVGIPDTVLQKRGPLDEIEWELMRQHSALGARIVASIGSLAHLAPAVRAEHERWDGEGYPDRLRGDQIPVSSRIILAADAFHAMTSDRPYREAMDLAAAVEELRHCAGTQFDPAVVEALIGVVAPA